MTLHSAAISAVRRYVVCDKTTIEGICVFIKIKKILLFFGIHKVTSTKYFMESTWYLSMSKSGRKRTRECRKTRDFRYKSSKCKYQERTSETLPQNDLKRP